MRPRTRRDDEQDHPLRADRTRGDGSHAPSLLASVALGSCGLLLLAGCAAIPWPHSGRAAPDVARAPGDLLDLRGVVHVHTRGSHDSPGTIDEVVRAAARAGVSWVALTEHVRPGTIELQGRVGDVTIVPGYEISAAGGSMLAIGVRDPPPRLRDPAALVDWIHAAGGLAFVGHLEKSRLTDSAVYRALPLDGVEILNLHAVARERALRLAVRLLFLPAPLAFKTLLQTPHENLARWASLPAARGVVGGVDAHAKYRLLGPVGGNVDRYRDVFRMLTTHVLAVDVDGPSILEALRAGRSYVALEGLGTVDRFRFELGADGYRIGAPRVARLALVCDGVEVAALRAEEALLPPPPDARRCRAEAWLGERLWVVTSYREVVAPTVTRLRLPGNGQRDRAADSL